VHTMVPPSPRSAALWRRERAREGSGVGLCSRMLYTTEPAFFWQRPTWQRSAFSRSGSVKREQQPGTWHSKTLVKALSRICTAPRSPDGNKGVRAE
jgi:hypothetical protein